MSKPLHTPFTFPHSRKHLLSALALLEIFALALLTGCGSTASTKSSSAISFDKSELFTNRDQDASYDTADAVSIVFSSDSITCTDEAVTISDSAVTISAAGTYILSGVSDHGQLIIDTPDDDKVQLVFHGITLDGKTTAPIYVRNADKVFITLAEGTENVLSVSEEFIQIDDNTIDAVIFSKDDLSFNGTGSLTLHAPYGHGIVSKDDLVITDGEFSITASRHGICGSDSIRILNGTFCLDTGKDGLHASNDDSEGFIYIADGSFTISSDDDGMHADSELYIADGRIDIQKSYEGLEGQSITIAGGDIQIVSSDDGINASSGSASSQNDMQKLPEDMTPPDMETMPEDMTPPDTKKMSEDMTPPDMETMPEDMTPPDMETMPEDMTPPDKKDMTDSSANNNGDNTKKDLTLPDKKDMTDSSVNNNFNNNNTRNNAPWKGFGFGGSFDMDADESCSLTISGGTISIDADGDGIDSNGYFYMTGGVVFIAGPESNGDSALDYGISATISGGSFLALGFSGMAQSFDRTSEQISYLLTLSSTVEASASSVSITDLDGNLLLTHDTAKAYNCVLISCPDLQTGTTYTLTAGTITQEFTPN